LTEHGLTEIDLVVCNLYPFEQTVAKPGVTEAEAIENIDIGGPCMVRAAAKNFDAVMVLTDPSHYSWVLRELGTNSGSTTRELRHAFARQAFERIADYDYEIVGYFSKFP